MIARAVFRRQGWLPGQRSPRVGNLIRFAGGIRNGAATVSGGQIHAVGDRSAPIWPTVVNPGEAVLDAEQTAHVTGIAVGIPATSVDDHQRLLEVVFAVEQRMDD